MRNFWIVGAAAIAVSPAAADAQAVARSVSGPGASFATARAGDAFAGTQSAPIVVRPNGPVGGRWTGPPPMANGNGGWSGANAQSRSWSGARWGQRIDGRWHGGWQAPGGWNAYRQPTIGWVLPSYWFAPGWGIADYGTYHLGTPPYGYSWSRYYDDAVLIDGRGRVRDYVSGIDWDRYDGGYAYDDGRDDRPRDRRDDGVGGAVIGGVAGGVAGNLIAGRGNRLAGTVIGAGVGAIAGAAIDRAEDRGRRYDDRHGARYDDRYDDRGPPVAPSHAPPPPEGWYEHDGGGDGRVRTRTWVSGGGTYVAGGSIVTVQPTVVTTTTTTSEYVIEDAAFVSHRRVARRAPVRSKILYRNCRCTFTK